MGSKCGTALYVPSEVENFANLVTSCKMNMRLALPIFVFIFIRILSAYQFKFIRRYFYDALCDILMKYVNLNIHESAILLSSS